MKTQDDLQRALKIFQRSCTMLLDWASYAASEKDRLVAEQCDRADRAAAKRGWFDDRDVEPTLKQHLWSLSSLACEWLADKAGRQAQLSMKKLGLTIEEVEQLAA